MLKGLEPIIRLLFIGIMVSAALTLLVAKVYPNDGQTFQVMSNLLAGFSGAFFGRMKPKTEASDSLGDAPKPDPTTGAAK